MPARKSQSKECTMRMNAFPAVIERAQTLILNDLGQSLRVLIDIAKSRKLWRPKGHMFFSRKVLAHTSHLIQNCLSDNVDMFWFKEFWPPNSPDLNLLDYYVPECS